MLSDPERYVLGKLGSIPAGHGLSFAENKYWHRTAQDLIARGFVKEEWGFYYLTDAGRSQLQSNSANGD